MTEPNRYALVSGKRLKSSVRRARRQRQMILTTVAFVLCAGISLFVYLLGTAGKETPQAAGPTPTMVVRPEDTLVGKAGAYGLYTVKYLENLSPDELWMEDFEDTRTPQEVKAIYVTSDVLNKKLDRILQLLDTTELNAVVIDIKNDDGYIVVDTESEYLDALGNKKVLFRDFKGLMQTLKEHNVYCIARIVCFRDIRTLKSAPELGVKMPDGTLMKDNSGYTWLNPFDMNTWEYLTEVGREAVKLGFDEVNFDYCRFSTDAKVKQADFGVAELNDAVKMDAISGFVRYACEQLKPLGVFVSVDVFGVVISSEIDAAAVGQDYAEMSKYLDYICPMVYPSHYGRGYYNLKVPDAAPYELIYNAMLDSKQKLAANVASGRSADVRPWLQAFTATWVSGHITYGGPQIRAQINATYDAGYSGWLLWNAAGNYSADGLEAE